MKWLLFFIPFLLYADNEVRLRVNCQITINANNTAPKFSTLISSSNLEQPTPPATITLTSTPVVKTLSELQGVDTVSAQFTLRAVPNPGSLQGYTLAVNLLPQYINLDVQSSAFQTFQLFPLTTYRSTILNADFTGMNIWFQRVTSETFSTGVQLSPSLTSDNAIVSTKSDPKSITFTIRFSTRNILSLEPGIYWLQLLVGMDPYTATFEQLATNELEISTQIDVIKSYITQIDSILRGNNSPYKLTASQISILNANKKLLQKELNDTIKANS